MNVAQTKNLKIGARFSVVLLLVSLLLQLFGIYYTKYQLTSPLIPTGVVSEIIKPSIYFAFITLAISLIVLVPYYYKKYIVVIIITLLTLVWRHFFPYLIY